jgi:very-short-patch-repair endonuclease
MSEFVKHLRSNATNAERIVWSMLRAGRLGGLKFKRQMQLGPYIVDFVCFDEKLIVEVDGSQHAESQKDAQRDAYFVEAGYRTLRFWNNEAMSNRDGLAKAILAAAGREI